jgi:hypothetical protein
VLIKRESIIPRIYGAIQIVRVREDSRAKPANDEVKDTRLSHDHLRAYTDAVVQIDDVFIEQTDAA